ncbi:hypothetical protein [Anaeromicropila populeti]|uniref:Uncharacterized protein n=1 Tax=Anaeromicropila populeti TaxID=37658 RepID=A0A1I6JFG4_9FIRM|nr:hypothetical protein [Anaeromicropila populeti]SFR77350.1 hypothetical protein SAMN05661086_01614 [Anaeromicropila populeti]
MNLETLAMNYYEKKKESILDIMERHPYNYYTFIDYEQNEAGGARSFISYALREMNLPEEIRNAVDAIEKDFSQFIFIKLNEQRQVSNYLFQYSLARNMQKIIAKPTDEQVPMLNFFQKNLKDAETQMHILKESLPESFDLNKVAAYYEVWEQDYRKTQEKQRRNELKKLEEDMEQDY